MSDSRGKRAALTFSGTFWTEGSSGIWVRDVGSVTWHQTTISLTKQEDSRLNLNCSAEQFINKIAGPSGLPSKLSNNRWTRACAHSIASRFKHFLRSCSR